MVTLGQSSPGDRSARAPQSKTATVMTGWRGAGSSEEGKSGRRKDVGARAGWVDGRWLRTRTRLRHDRGDAIRNVSLSRGGSGHPHPTGRRDAVCPNIAQFGGSGRAYGGCRRRSRTGAITRDCASCRRRATRWLGVVGPEALRAVARGHEGSGLFERSAHFSVVLLPITFVQLLSRRI